MRTISKILIAIAVSSILLTGCVPETIPSPSPSSVSFPHLTPTTPADGTVCSLDASFWTEHLGAEQYSEMFFSDDSVRPNAANPTTSYGCTIFSIVPGEGFNANRHKVGRIEAFERMPGNEGPEAISRTIDAAIPEQTFIARGHKAWAYPGAGPTPVKANEYPGTGMIRWRCGEMTVVVDIYATNANGHGPETARAVFDQIVDGVKCDA